jgi:hypothetical protein
MANMLFANNANTTLNGGITAVATSMVVTSATGFPSPTGSQYFYCTLADAATQTTIEIVKVTAVSGTTFTIVRGQDGTSGTAFSSGAVVSLRLVRASLNDFPKLDENNTFTYAPTFNTALAVGSGGTGVTSATGTGAGASVVLSQAPAINSPVITSYSTSTVPLKVLGLSGQITELFDVYTYSGGSCIFQINSSGAISTGTWNGSVIGAAYGGTGEAGTLTGILYGNGTSAHTVATTAQLLSGIGTLPVTNGGTGLTSFTANGLVYASSTSALATNLNLTWDTNNLKIINSGSYATFSASNGTDTSWFGFAQSVGNYNADAQASDALIRGKNGVSIAGNNGAAGMWRLDSGGSVTLGGNQYTTGYVTAINFVPTGSSIPSNGMYLPASNTVAWSTASTARMQIGGTGGVSIGNTTDPGAGNLSISGNVYAKTTVYAISSGATQNLFSVGSYNSSCSGIMNIYSTSSGIGTVRNYSFSIMGSGNIGGVSQISAEDYGGGASSFTVAETRNSPSGGQNLVSVTNTSGTTAYITVTITVFAGYANMAFY